MANDQNREVMKTQGNGEFEFTGQHRINLHAKEKFEFRGGKVSAIILYWFNIPGWPK